MGSFGSPFSLVALGYDYVIMSYQAKIAAPFGVLGIRCSGEALTGIDILPPGTRLQEARDGIALRVCEQLRAYLADPAFRFDLPLKTGGTPYQHKVWRAMRRIRPGEVATYGELAARLQSSPRAVGQACGANPILIVIPCHRVVSKSGMGGYMGHLEGHALDIKRWLLAHEGRFEQ